jgi:endogenous inhibitor of DNA gyrase (YacG/DUF329 family)
MKVECPHCKKMTEFSPKNAFRPFCSDRCKLLDLGAWAMEKHAIPSDHDTDASKEAPHKPEKDDDE